MSILVDLNTRVICQGMTGRQGSFYTERALAYGTRVVAGVTPGKGGTRHLDSSIPVFDSVAEARDATGAVTSAVFVPPASAAEAIVESINAEMALIVCVTERIPLHDMMRVKHRLKNSQSRLIGPNSLGIITPGECKIGVMPGSSFKPGPIGVVSRPSTLTGAWRRCSKGGTTSTGCADRWRGYSTRCRVRTSPSPCRRPPAIARRCHKWPRCTADTGT